MPAYACTLEWLERWRLNCLRHLLAQGNRNQFRYYSRSYAPSSLTKHPTKTHKEEGETVASSARLHLPALHCDLLQLRRRGRTNPWMHKPNGPLPQRNMVQRPCVERLCLCQSNEVLSASGFKAWKKIPARRRHTAEAYFKYIEIVRQPWASLKANNYPI